MKKEKLMALALLWLMITILMTSPAAAQDFTKLLDAISNVENNLKSLVEKEASTRASEIAALRGELSEGAIAEPQLEKNPVLAQIRTDLEVLHAEIEKMKDTYAENPILEYDSAQIQTQAEINSLKERVEQMAEKITAAGNAKDADKKSLPNPVSTSYGKITLKGVVQQQFYYRMGKDPISNFDSKRVQIAIGGEVNRWAKAEFLGEFAKTPKLLDAVITLTPVKNWSFIAGQYKPPFGIEFLRSANMMPFIFNSKASALGTDRDIGISTGLTQPLATGMSLKLMAGVFNGAPMNTADANRSKNLVARAEFKFADMFTIGPNAITGKTNDPDSTKKSLDVIGSSFTWNWKNETVEADYIHSKVGTARKAGWYIWAGHTFKLNLTFLPELQPLARFESYDPNLDLSSDATTRTTLGANLFIDKKYTKIQVNYHFNGEESKPVRNDELMFNLQASF